MMKLVITIGAVRPREFDSIRPKTMPPRPTVANAAPSQSTRPLDCSSRLSGTRLHAISNTTAASGMLIKKIHRHENLSTSQPPKTGPTPAAIDVNPDHVPMACPRRSLLKLALINARLPGTRNAAPTPCAPRAMISCTMSGARPHQTEARAKSRTPDAKTRLRPRRSPSEPPTRINAASIRAYDSTIHCAPATLAPSSLCNMGSAMLTTVPSMNVILEPRIAAASTQRPVALPQSLTSGRERTTASSQGCRVSLSIYVGLRLSPQALKLFD